MAVAVLVLGVVGRRLRLAIRVGTGGLDLPVRVAWLTSRACGSVSLRLVGQDLLKVLAAFGGCGSGRRSDVPAGPTHKAIILGM